MRHMRTTSQLCWAIPLQLRHVSTIEKYLKYLLNSNLPTCAHNMVNFGPLAAEIGSLVWGTPANFNGFRVLASLLLRRRSTEANQTLHDVWPSPGLVYYIYTFGGSCPVTEFCQVKFHFASSKSCSLLYWLRYCTALEQWTSAKLCGVEQRVPPIFGRVAITLGFGPHSSFYNICCFINIYCL